MNIKLGVKFEVGKIDIDPFQDTDDEIAQTKPYITGIKTEVWSVDPITCTKANMKAIIDEQYSKLNQTNREFK